MDDSIMFNMVSKTEAKKNKAIKAKKEKYIRSGSNSKKKFLQNNTPIK